jgi:hypothetical protein
MAATENSGWKRGAACVAAVASFSLAAVGCSSPASNGARDAGSTLDASAMDASTGSDAPGPDDGGAQDGLAQDAPTQDSPTQDAPDDGASCAKPSIDPEVVMKGSPSWRLAEMAVYQAPCGTPSDQGAEATASLDAVFKPKHAIDPNLFLMKAALPHNPPYDTETAQGVVKAGFVNAGCFPLSALTAPQGIIISMNLVPSASAPTGISFELPDGGRMILFDSLTITGHLLNGIALVDPNFGSTFPKAAFVYDYEGGIMGFGHLLLNWAENQLFSPQPLTTGDYSFQITLDDGANATYDVVHFHVQ